MMKRIIFKLAQFMLVAIFVFIANICALAQTQGLSDDQIRQIALADSIDRAHPYFIYTYDGRVIPGRIIDYKKPLFEEGYLEVDKQKIFQEVAKFYVNETGFYANLKTLKLSGRSEFAERVRKGKINLYTLVKYNTAPGFGGGPNGMVMTGSVTTKTILNYYNIGFADLKKANYKNLLADLQSNPNSMIHLNKYKSNKGAVTALYVIGSAVLVVGVTSLYNKTKDPNITPEPNVTINIVALVSGAGIIGLGTLVSTLNDKNLVKAIDEFNL
jgi:hypothetical protein